MDKLPLQQGNQRIRDRIDSGQPFIASKMGGVEQQLLACALTRTSYDCIRDGASHNAGVTPNDDHTLNEFVNLYAYAVQNTDILGVMDHPHEPTLIAKLAPNTPIYGLRILEPFYFDQPWSAALKHRNVLVISPFRDSIVHQYANRQNLFSNPDVLPHFNLQVIKAAQTNGGGVPGCKPFFESLDTMMQQIDKIDFDIALIGCGAYGMLLSNHIKLHHKKQAVCIGGGLQILFGIKGRRWDVHPEISALFNEHWIRPSAAETPIAAHLVEGATYW